MLTPQGVRRPIRREDKITRSSNCMVLSVDEISKFVGQGQLRGVGQSALPNFPAVVILPPRLPQVLIIRPPARPVQNGHRRSAMSISAAFRASYPWIQAPLIVSAPMRLVAFAPLAVEVSRAGELCWLSNRAAMVENIDSHVQVAWALLLQEAIQAPSSRVSVKPMGGSRPTPSPAQARTRSCLLALGSSIGARISSKQPPC